MRGFLAGGRGVQSKMNAQDKIRCVRICGEFETGLFRGEYILVISGVKI